MAIIRETATGQTHILEAEHSVGRLSTSALRIEQRFVSAQHAIVRFTAGGWEVRDLGSRNGTFVNGEPIPAGSEVSIRLGSKLAFGKASQEWEIIDDGPPSVVAIPLSGGDPVCLEGEMIALPSVDDPRVTIYRDADGTWLLEQPESTSPIGNLQMFEVDGRPFRFSCPDYSCRTSLMEVAADLEAQLLSLQFFVSSDEEHVELHATYGMKTIDLGARSHNYLLLTLARRRLKDTAEGLSESNCGWVYMEDLAHDPSMAPPQLNIDVYRIRKHFAAAGVIDAGNVIERRPRTRQLRLGISRIAVTAL